MEGCGFRDLHGEFQKKNAVVYGISYDKPADNAAFAQKFKFPYALLSDEDCAIAKAYGAFDAGSPGYPRRNTYVISPEGKLEHVIEGVKPKFHAQELLTKLPG
jgi:peroxiredoxin Q/BCP